ncbi:class I SAM-dependent methyltransferase [Kiloniella laminariae]|uniref:Class I SAM-dependent methyltransferase n=1 Tax=Kiloniella laminariae TaxID=454162 RepID=A0ABT4LF49_9PROT|nr:class I SAM-dependent methyltransferase [Kiloniella laminariae]MCZ4279555.1 class I SAM-dependent methyltransferase [Kiloniella laminariae]
MKDKKKSPATRGKAAATVKKESGYSNQDSLAPHLASLLLGDTAPSLEEILATDYAVPPFSASDFPPFDHLHTRGLVATREMAEFLPLNPGSHILDVGCGIGGPARYIAEQFACHVDGIDLTKDFCEAARLLNHLSGLDRQITITYGSALDLPYPDDSFDIVWTQHTSMNIADKEGFYTQIHRVLKPGGMLLFHDIFLHPDTAGKTSQILLPVPWASEKKYSHLTYSELTRDLLADMGFQREVWNDVTAETLLWYLNSADGNPQKSKIPGLDPRLLIGQDLKLRASNLKQNLSDGKLQVMQGVFKKVI